MRKKVININSDLCIGCGACATACAEGAIKIVDGKAKLISDSYCDGLGNCLPHCPVDAIEIIEKEVNQSTVSAGPINNWPIQLKLVNEESSIFNNQDLLIAADCTAFSTLNFHRKYARDRMVLICCPKLDNSQEYLIKFINIFKKHNIKSIFVTRMTVPCCSGLTTIVKTALKMVNKKMDSNEIVLSVDY